jgi:hypothetical protein
VKSTRMTRSGPRFRIGNVISYAFSNLMGGRAMKASLLFVASLAVAILSIALLLCGLSGTAMSQTATPSGGATTSLPNVLVEAPKQRAVARSTVSPRTSSTTPTPSTSPMSPAERELAKLPNAITGSCAGGCASSFRSGDAPWVGCSSASGRFSSTCRNVGNFKTYTECTTASNKLGSTRSDTWWYCSSLGFKN